MKHSEQSGVISVEQPVTMALPEAAHEGVWSWFAAMARSLGLIAEILDARDVPGPVLSVGAAANALRTALSDPQSPERAAVKAARASALGVAEADTPDRTVCYRLAGQDLESGVLVLAQDRTRVSPRHSLSPKVAADDSTLDRIGPWLARAVQAQMTTLAVTGQADAGDDDFDRVAALRKLLQEAADRGGEVEVLTAFGEALFAWDGVEVRGYVEDLQGGFAEIYASPGAAPAQPHVSVETSPSLRSIALTVVPVQDLIQLGLPRGRRTMAIQLQTPLLEPCIIVCAEAFRPIDRSRLSLAASLLQESLERAAVTAETRATWAILQPLLNARGQIEAALDTAMQELALALAAAGAALTVQAPNGALLLAVGESDAASAVRPFSRQPPLTTTLPVRDLYMLTITVRRGNGRVFTLRERQLVERVGSLIAAWLPATIAPTSRQPERRAESREFEMILERAAGQTLRDGHTASVIVMTLPPDASRGESVQRWLADIRGQLRGSDLAGMLSDREIGVLLSGTPTNEVPMVSARLQRCLATEAGPLNLAVGSSSRTAERDSTDSLVRQARINARHGSMSLVENRQRPGIR